MMHWPDEHVAWQGVIHAAPDMSVQFGVHVFVFHTLDQLRAACDDPKASAHSLTYAEPDAANIGAVVFFAKPHLELSLVTHECTHIALFHHSHTARSRIGARRWLAEHPETIAEMVGNLTALVWYGVQTFQNHEG